MRKRSRKETSQESSSPIESHNHSSSFSFRIPSFSVPSSSFVPIIYVLLLIASFLLGSLVTKVQYLEKNASLTQNVKVQTAQPTGSAQVQQPTPAGPTAQVNLSPGHLPIKGNSDAKVTVVEFADFRCPFCEQFFTTVLTQLQKDYIDRGKVKFAFRHFAFLGPASIVAANASECANEQNKFWEFHDYLYKNQPPESDITMYTTDKLTDVAGQLGLDTNQFRSCLSQNKDNQSVQNDLSDAQRAGVTATPTFFINGNPLIGAQPYSTFKAAIDAQLAKTN